MHALVHETDDRIQQLLATCSSEIYHQSKNVSDDRREFINSDSVVRLLQPAIKALLSPAADRAV